MVKLLAFVIPWWCLPLEYLGILASVKKDTVILSIEGGEFQSIVGKYIEIGFCMQENIQKQDSLSKIAMAHVYLRLQLG